MLTLTDELALVGFTEDLELNTIFDESGEWGCCDCSNCDTISCCHDCGNAERCCYHCCSYSGTVTCVWCKICRIRLLLLCRVALIYLCGC